MLEATDSPEDPKPARCPHCQAEIYWSDASQCWMCGQALGRLEPPGAPSPPPEAAARRTFGLTSLMLIIVVIAVCLGVLREVPWMGILLAGAVVPALAWTVVVVARSKARRGRPLPAREKVGIFGFALAAVAAIWAAALVAFVITCFPVGMATMDGGANGFILACGVGGVAALAAGYGSYRLFRLLWRSRPRKE